MAGAKDALTVGQDLAVLALGLGVAVGPLGEPGLGGAGGQGIGMILPEDPAAILEHTAAQLTGLAELAAQPGQPGHRLAGGEGIGMIVAENLPAAAEHL